MLGVDQAASTLGIIPCAIYWLFTLINDRREKTGARFSVRVSAVEITGKQETLKDLLADVAPSKLAGVHRLLFCFLQTSCQVLLLVAGF
jgi:kinesin family protein 26